MATKMDMTAEEAGMFAKHLKDPKFIELFEEYATTLKDPKTAAEQNAYLAQLEAGGQAESVYGKGVQLIVPEAWFVVKTKDESGTNRVYINICTSPKVDEMKLAPADDGSGPRRQLQLPMVLHGKDGRQGTAPDGGPLLVWDLAVNPNAVQHANSSRQALDTLVIMAIERVEEVLGRKLLREYKLPRLKYKATPAAAQPCVMAARTAEGGDVVGGRLRPKAEAAASSPADSSRPDSSAASDKASSRSGFSFSKAQAAAAATAAAQQQAACAPSQPTAAGYQHACGAVTPSWECVERHRTDMQESWGDIGRGLQARSSAPQELVVRVQLPGVESSAAVELDIGSDKLHVHVPGKYLLDLGPAQLRHSLLPDKGSAKFIKAKQQLSVTLAVAPPPQQQQHRQETPAANEQLVEQPELQQKQLEEPQQEQEQGQEHHQQQQQQQTRAAQHAPDTPQLEESKPAADATVVLTRQPSSDQAASKTSLQSKWDEVHQNLDKQQQQQQQQQHPPDIISKTGASGSQQQPQPPLVKPRLLSSRLSSLADLD
uniref:PIH1 domain-containing protein 1 n=1 Tax=Tetradesmus obliquus TaxID=3088 RepID=A0A383W8J9_TETOB|eukprot:jgi/Sobl393_1/3231/SZX73751.1